MWCGFSAYCLLRMRSHLNEIYAFTQISKLVSNFSTMDMGFYIDLRISFSSAINFFHIILTRFFEGERDACVMNCVTSYDMSNLVELVSTVHCSFPGTHVVEQILSCYRGSRITCPKVLT